MNVVAIQGSPRPKGNTVNLLSEFLSGFSKYDKIDLYNIFDIDPKACNDCGYCKNHCKCYYEDLDFFMDTLEAADTIIVASPIYNLTFPAPLKALYDRFQRYYNARFVQNKKPPINKPKKGGLLLTCGSSSYDGFNIAEKQTRLLFSILNTTLAIKFYVPNTDYKEISDSELKEVGMLCRKYFNS